MTTQRIEAFSDGVFAIAITLLILEVKLPPDDGTSLAHRLGETWPSYIAFLISFLIIGIMWANHHSDFHLIGRATHGLVVANLFLLLCAFVRLSGRHLERASQPGHQRRPGPLLPAPPARRRRC